MGAYRVISAVMLLILITVLFQLFSNLSQAASSHIRIIQHRDLEVRLDLSTQILHLDIPLDKEMMGFREEMDPSSYGSKLEATLYPTIESACRGNPHFISASLFIAKAKQSFDCPVRLGNAHIKLLGHDEIIRGPQYATVRGMVDLLSVPNVEQFNYVSKINQRFFLKNKVKGFFADLF